METRIWTWMPFIPVSDIEISLPDETPAIPGIPLDPAIEPAMEEPSPFAPYHLP